MYRLAVRPLKPADLRAEADRIEREGQRQAAEAHEIAEQWRRAADVIEAAGTLSVGTLTDTLSSDVQTEGQRQAAMKFAKTKGRNAVEGGKDKLHPVQAWYYKRTQAPRGPEELANALEIKNVMTVRGWVRAADPRRIPESIAKEIERRWGLPATLKTWPNGIRWGK